jgi:hypothetical protein
MDRASESVTNQEAKAQLLLPTKQPRQASKFNWILTYNAHGRYINPEMLRLLGNIHVDECHSTKDQIMAYTYIHVLKPVRSTTIEKFMKKAKDAYGIVRAEMFGYDSIVCNSKFQDDIIMQEHPGFKVLVKHYLEKNPAFQAWTDDEPVPKRGNLLKAAELILERPDNIEQKSKTKIIQYTKKLESRLKEATKRGFKIIVENNDDDMSEFDVVKKRRAMESAPPDEEDAPDALEAFEHFEQSVLPALERIILEDRQYHYAELQEFEDAAAAGTPLSTTGGVYFAWSPCLKCTKIGATRRDSPTPRLRELSRHVTEPFVLIGWIPSTTPFRREATAHAHFTAKRIRHAGAGTEFFILGDGEALEYCRVANATTTSA